MKVIYAPAPSEVSGCVMELRIYPPVHPTTPAQLFTSDSATFRLRKVVYEDDGSLSFVVDTPISRNTHTVNHMSYMLSTYFLHSARNKHATTLTARETLTETELDALLHETQPRLDGLNEEEE